MKRQPRLWICGVCQNNAKELQEILAPLYPNFRCEDDHDYPLGTIWVDGGSQDNNESMVVIAAHNGIMLHRKWTNDHDFQMNVYLRSGHIQHGDWIIQLDTSERLNPDFIETLQQSMLKNFEEQGMNTIYQRSKPLMFRYHDDQVFSGSPHWGLRAQRHHMTDISKFDGFQNDKSYCWSLRDNINKWIVNGIKYYYVYGRSNHMWLVYHIANYPGATDALIHEHEEVRQRFRNYCRTTLDLPLHGSANEIMAGLDAYLKEMNFTPEFVEFMNFEKTIASYYRYLHGEDQKIIFDTQNEWQF